MRSHGGESLDPHLHAAAFCDLLLNRRLTARHGMQWPQTPPDAKHPPMGGAAPTTKAAASHRLGHVHWLLPACRWIAEQGALCHTDAPRCGTDYHQKKEVGLGYLVRLVALFFIRL